MAIFGAWTCPYIYVDGYKLSADMVEATLNYNADVLDATRFCDLTRVNLAGLKNVALTGRGWTNFAEYEQDAEVYANVGTANVPVSIFPTNTPVAGDPAFFFNALTAQYVPGGSVGEIMGFNFDMRGSSAYPLCRGWVLEPGTTAKDADGNGTAVEAIAVAADQYLYAVLHVTSITGGDTIDVTIESDVAGFGTPTVRATFAQKAAIGSEIITRIAGPITDTWWRCVHDISVPATVTFACAMAIH